MAAKKILIVEDEADLRAISRLALESAGYQVVQAENGRKGLEAVKQGAPDLITIDIMMPQMNGIEFCRRLIDEFKLAHVPVLLVSGVNKKAKIIEEFFQLPLAKSSFLQKPVDAKDILAEVKKLIGDSGAEERKPSAAPPKAAAPQAASPKPAAAPSREAAPAAPEADPKGPRFRVLSIDDDEDIRMLLKTSLSLRYQVETAENGMAGLAAIDRFEPDFVICDINMPLLNGLETVEAIRKHPRFSDVPVFFLSAETDTNLPRKAFDIGANLFLKKPLDPMRMLKLIDYFITESKLQPRPRGAAAGPGRPAAGKSAGPSPTPPPGGAAVRVLTVDSNADTMAFMKRTLDGHTHRKIEKLWSEEVRAALGNLMRWEPDIIFFNPRNPGMDGIAFGQTLKLKKLVGKYEIAFIGKEFFDAEIDYSKKNFGREPIRILPDNPASATPIFAAIEAARGKLSPKQHDFESIEAEDRAHGAAVKAQRDKVEKQRDIFREKFNRIQDFIDREQQSV